MDCLQLPCIRVEEAVSWTQRFLTRKLWLKNRSLFMTNKFKRKCLQKFYFSSKQDKEWYRKTTSFLEQPSRPFLSALHAKNDTTSPFGYKLGVSTENNKAPLFFSGKETVQTFSGSICCCLRNDKLVNCHVWKFCKDLFLNLRVIWSVNQIVLFSGFLSDFVEITSCVYTKTIILFNLGE